MSSKPHVPGVSVSFGWKTIFYHFYAFFFLELFLLFSLVQGKKTRYKLIILSIIISITYAILDEFHQLFVPGRSFTISDILTDSAGVLLASYLYLLISLQS